MDGEANGSERAQHADEAGGQSPSHGGFNLINKRGKSMNFFEFCQALNNKGVDGKVGKLNVKSTSRMSSFNKDPLIDT